MIRGLALLLALCAQTPTFSSRVEAVRVDVLVTEDGRAVTGLRSTDFELFDNGVRQTIDLTSLDRSPINVVLALDMSNSVKSERLSQLQGAGAALLDGLKVDDRAALVTFSHRVGLRRELTRDHADVRAALAAIEADGYTALIDGTFAGLLLGESDMGRSLVIVFSDGVDTASWLTDDAVLEAARGSDAVVYAVSAGGGDVRFLRDLSKLTGGALLEVDSMDNLRAVFLKVLEEFRQRYLLSYSPTGVARGGWHRLEVRLKGRRATVKARPGYQGG